MENASKALIMAGTLLIAILTIAALVYAINYWDIIPESQAEAKRMRQITEFNQQYESYNKSVLLGTDVLSVVGKSINNNEYQYTEDNYAIDIQFKLIKQIKNTTITYKLNSETETYEVGREYSGAKMEVNKTYSTITDKKFLQDELLKGSKESVAGIRTEVPPNSYKIEYSMYIDFKRKVFTCEEIKYNKVTGRVELMVFKEIKATLYEEY
ncbi:MAG: hypothetical protein LBL91_05265 [Lachnospiraceae bacterium]|nr:hypothetical protein [Lachnospiraceae bacterium]